jgi:hypothetical protein
VRADSLAERLDVHRLRGKMAVDPQPSDELWRLGLPSVTGASVAETYGHLLHYTVVDFIGAITTTGVGRPGHGVWLTPSSYSACVVPYRLGLTTPRDVCVVVDVSTVPDLWGPGTARPGAAVWTGGGLEFFASGPIPPSNIVDVIGIATCGDA